MTHENNENLVSVFNIFLKSMMKVEGAGFINLTNCKNDELSELINYDILFYATTRFTWAFVEAF